MNSDENTSADSDLPESLCGEINKGGGEVRGVAEDLGRKALNIGADCGGTVGGRCDKSVAERKNGTSRKDISLLSSAQ